ncbi:MAG: phosphoribosyl-ATP pyrophosphohydrolase [Christensenellales bacterium]|jgi:predicted house-cleaning noncanonical NTP pyrophosphatase (MazG superfamily)|nr:nucleoside triphosphate pyrophosphohydrolase [Clostridiales bacterium]
MKTIKYNKLIRDKIPQIIEASGKKCKTRILDEVEYKEHLKLKLQEELNEYLESDNVEELADLYEVLKSILDLENISLEEFNKIVDSKSDKRGGFKKRLLLIEVSEEDKE